MGHGKQGCNHRTVNGAEPIARNAKSAIAC